MGAEAGCQLSKQALRHHWGRNFWNSKKAVAEVLLRHEVTNSPHRHISSIVTADGFGKTVLSKVLVSARTAETKTPPENRCFFEGYQTISDCLRSEFGARRGM